MGQVQFPTPIATDDAFESAACGEGVIGARVLRAGLADDQVPDVLAVDWIGR